jgi:hypothetical protein
MCPALLKRTFYNSTGQKIYDDSNVGWLTGRNSKQKHGCLYMSNRVPTTLKLSLVLKYHFFVFVSSVDCVELPDPDPTLHF